MGASAREAESSQGGTSSLLDDVARWSRAAQLVPRMAVGAFRHGLLPVGLSTASILRREGSAELHWKVLGDSLVRFLQHSGPVFTKFGQILATRRDLLPDAVCGRLEALYSRQAPMSRRELQRALRQAHGKSSPFAELDRRALAVGSVGQVHRARLRDGTAVIVKVLRPDVEKLIERDLEAARVLVPLVVGAGGASDPSTSLLMKFLDDLAESFMEEVDLRREASSLADFARRFERNPNVVVPACYPALSTRHVIVMEELVGEPLSEYRRRAKKDPEAAQRVANLALQEILRQIFEDGRFHADPHAGNLLILEDGRLGLIDLGLTGELSAEDRWRIARAVRAFLARDSEALMSAVLDFGTTPEGFDRQRFRRDVEAVVRSRGRRVKSRLTGSAEDGGSEDDENPLEEMVSELFGVAHAHGVQIPRSSTLLIKTLVTAEGVGRSLHPELDLNRVARPVILRSIVPRWARWAFRGRS